MCLHTLTRYHQRCNHIVDTPRMGPSYIPPIYCDDVKYRLDLYHSQPLRLPEPEPLLMPSPCKIRWPNANGDSGNIISKVSNDACPTCTERKKWVNRGKGPRRYSGNRKSSWYREWGLNDKKARNDQLGEVNFGSDEHTSGENSVPTTAGIGTNAEFGNGMNALANNFGNMALQPAVVPGGVIGYQEPAVIDEFEELRKAYRQLKVPRTCGKGGPVIIENCVALDIDFGEIVRSRPASPSLSSTLSSVKSDETLLSPSGTTTPTLPVATLAEK